MNRTVGLRATTATGGSSRGVTLTTVGPRSAATAGLLVAPASAQVPDAVSLLEMIERSEHVDDRPPGRVDEAQAQARFDATDACHRDTRRHRGGLHRDARVFGGAE